MASNKSSHRSTTTTSTVTHRRPAPHPVPYTSSSGTSTTISETEPLLANRDSPPPRYSTIEDEWDVPLENPEANPPPYNPSYAYPLPSSGFLGHTANLATTHNAPAQPIQQTPLPCPGWWSWVPGPAQVFPPGLEHMTNIRKLTVHRKGKKYFVKRAEEVIYTTRRMKDTAGVEIYRVQNNANLDVLLLTATKKKDSIFSPAFLHIEVSFPPGNVVGVVQGSTSEYTGHNPSGDLLFLIRKEAKSCCGKPDFMVETKEMLPLGALLHLRGPGCCFADTNIMEVSFPIELDLRWKALLLGGALVIRCQNW